MMTQWTLGGLGLALAGALVAIGLMLGTGLPSRVEAAPLAQATATPTNTATPTATATPTSTPRAAAGWQRVDQPDGNVRCYLYEYGATPMMSCVVVTP